MAARLVAYWITDAGVWITTTMDSMTVRVDMSSTPYVLRGIQAQTSAAIEVTDEFSVITDSDHGFTLAAVPVGSIHVYRNGLLQRLGLDYATATDDSGRVRILLVTTAPGDLVTVTYHK